MEKYTLLGRIVWGGIFLIALIVAIPFAILELIFKPFDRCFA